jgi:putative transposase
MMEDRIKAIKIQIYPNLKQKETIDKTIGCTRFIYNQMLAERIKVYEELKADKEKLYKHKYKTEKEYKQDFEFLKEASSRALQQSRNDLDVAYKMFYKRVKSKKAKVGFPKFKSKKKAKMQQLNLTILTLIWYILTVIIDMKQLNKI